MGFSQPIHADLEREFGVLLALLDDYEASPTDRLMVWITAAAALAVALSAGASAFAYSIV